MLAVVSILNKSALGQPCKLDFSMSALYCIYEESKKDLLKLSVKIFWTGPANI